MTHERLFLLPALFAMLLPAGLFGQSPCPTSTLQGSSARRSTDLICIVPQVFGAGGLVGADNGGPLTATTGHEVHFQASSLSNFGPVNSEIGVELSQLPLAAPVAGFVFSGGALIPTENYGPVLTDRAETIGKGKLFLGASYQYFDFDKADGTSLRSFGVVLTHEPEPTVCGTQQNVACLDGEPIYTRDIVATQDRVDLKVHEVTAVATFGIGQNLDLSVAIPVLDVRMNMDSSATIFNFEPPPVNHTFDPAAVTANPHEKYLGPYNAIFQNPDSGTGLGDITLRAKLRAWRKADERSSIAVGVDGRVPSGNAYKFLGSGTWGIRPFLIYSHANSNSRLAENASVGFQGNGNSVLAGNVTSQPVAEAKMPDILTYTAGGDIGLFSHVSVASDVIGQTLLSSSKILPSTYTDFAGATHADISTSTATVNELSVSVGGKIAIGARLLLTGNVLIRVNDAGLHSKPAPLGGISYTF